jgi:threonine dehydrogenase-like Zn-dependent dehydrogenase
MKGLVYGGDKSVHWTDVSEPRETVGEDLVDVLVAGICGTDLGAVRNGRPPLPMGMTIGHEFVGRRRRDGVLVVANPILSCGHCRACGEGRQHLCESRQVLGVHRPGAFAETISVPSGNLTDARGLDAARAAMVEPIATALHAWRLSPQPSSNVAVLGAGPIGMSLLHVLKSTGVSEITVTDISPERQALALACGADFVGEAADGSYETVLDTVGAVSTRKNAVDNVRTGGTAIFVGLHSPDLAVAGGQIVAGEKTIRGSFAYTPKEFDEAIGLAASLDIRWIATVPFDRSQQAFSDLLAGKADPSGIKVHIKIAE